MLTAILIARSRGVRETITIKNDAPARSVESAVPSDESGKKVSLAIDLGDGKPRAIEAVAWRGGMTVGDLLSAASQAPGGIQITSQGAGESTFLTAIDGVANEGAGGRNWTYSVNGERGDRSYAVYPLQPGDHVLWTFAGRQ